MEQGRANRSSFLEQLIGVCVPSESGDKKWGFVSAFHGQVWPRQFRGKGIFGWYEEWLCWAFNLLVTGRGGGVSRTSAGSSASPIPVSTHPNLETRKDHVEHTALLALELRLWFHGQWQILWNKAAFLFLKCFSTLAVPNRVCCCSQRFWGEILREICKITVIRWNRVAQIRVGFFLLSIKW